MTEAEAKTKWCPMRRITRIGHISIDNTDGKDFTLNCLGSPCMMFREVSEMHEKRHAPLGVKERVVVGCYCGLAGKP